MLQTHKQQDILDNYGYPLPPDSRRKLRKTVIRTSKHILGKCIYFVMSIAGLFVWLGRLGTSPRRQRHYVSSAARSGGVQGEGKKYPALTPETFHPRRILVIRLDLIGDLVLSMTVVRALKRTYPDVELDLLTLPSSASITLNDPDLSEIITYDPNVWRRPKALIQVKNWRDAIVLVRHLRARRYDLAVSVFGEWAGIAAVLSGAKRRVGFGRESYPGFMTDSVPGQHWNPNDHKHEVDYCLELAQTAGATLRPGDRIPHLFIDPQAFQQVEHLLEQQGVQQAKGLIVCHVSSNNGQSKRWPIPYWATLIDRLIREEGAQVILTGTSNDLPLIERVTRRMHEHAINLAGRTSLIQLAALMKRADLLISGDSGPMHIAAAVGTPLVAIHGPTDPALTGPLSPTATVLRSGIWCSPCYNATDTADCPFSTTQCMKNILPAQVFEVAREKLMDYV